MVSDDVLINHLRRGGEQSGLEEQAWLQLEQLACEIPQGQTLNETDSFRDADSSVESPPLPVAFGPYLLLEQLGQGGMGIVYKARQEALKRPVALKLVRAGVFASAQERARFHREGEVIARVRHANVVQIYEFGESQGQLYFSMELLEGGTLANRLTGQPMPEREAAELVRTLAQAVEAAHCQGVVHRDLKPGNVMFAADGTAKITDFGLAKVLDEDSNETCSDAILGTAAYMAPEQARGDSRNVSPSSDVYALGAILYEALTGKPPHRGENRYRTLDLVLGQEPELPSRRRPGLSRDLEAICLKCLEKEADRRYPSASALAEDLDRWLRGEPTTVRPLGWRMRQWRSVRRRPRLVSAAAVLLFLAVAMPASMWHRNPERPRRAIETELARGRPQTLIPDSGGPRWSRWRGGEATSQMSVLADGTFSLSSWQTALLELVSDPQRPHYRFSALVRQERGRKQAAIGIYVAHCTHAHPVASVHQFVILTFYDIEHDIDNWERVVSKPLLPKPLPPKPPGNRAMLNPYLYAECAPEPWESSIRRGPDIFFEPTKRAPPLDWWELALEVTPQGVAGFWGDKKMNLLEGTQVVKFANDFLAGTRRSRPDDPLARGVNPIYAPRGGLGLYVCNGAASFRRVIVEPLEDAE